jgi:2-keto-4-pentenoate hydratase/2-oxohepta-3-ene-1,7-dioic acid hydratase in catechol pathway
VAAIPDELGDAWKGGKVHLPLRSTWNEGLVSQPEAGVDMVFNFPQLIAHLCKTRNTYAGSVVGSGTVSNKGSLARLLVHRGTALPGDDRIRAAGNAVHALRRHDPHRDA